MEILSNWIQSPVLIDLLIIALVIAFGVMLGSIPLKKFKLGVAGVLFMGLFVGHFGFRIAPHTQAILQELGLVMFVFMTGLQAGPGFLGSLRQNGLKYNGLALLLCVMSLGLSFGILSLNIVPPETAVGLFTGGLGTNAGLGAAQSSMSLIGASVDRQATLGLTHAITYPFSILGAIFSLVLLRLVLKVSLKSEAEDYEEMVQKESAQWESKSLVVENPNLEDVAVKDLPFMKERHVILSRILHEDELIVPKGSDHLHLNDILHVVGPKEALDDAEMLIGHQSDIDISQDNRVVSVRTMHVTSHELAGKTIRDIRMSCMSDVIVARVFRAGVDIPVHANLKLQLGDAIRVVGQDETLDALSQAIGNTVSDLDAPQLTPIFLGIGLGLALGSVALPIPGLPFPLKLGLAGGPLVIAMLLSKIGQIWKWSWYVPQGPNQYVRELGLALFLSCLGISGGAQFVSTLVQGPGLIWVGLGMVVTFIPLVVVGLIARYVYHINFLTISGVLAGTMTNAATFGFANSQIKTGAVSLAYATVFPFAIVLKIMLAQVMVLVLMS